MATLRLSEKGVLAALLLLGPGAAGACPPPDPSEPFVDRPAALYSDGSFVDAAADDRWYRLTGRPVRDVGGGRIGQVIEEGYCEVSQMLLFVDCTTGSAILVHGILGGPGEEGVGLSTRALQPPYGPLALTSATTVVDVAAIAAGEGWAGEADVLGWAAERGPRNRVDPFFGCTIFYPGSVGAGRYTNGLR